MSDIGPTVLVLGRRTTDNMPSLTRMLEILRPTGMDATVPTSSVRITSAPSMGGTTPPCPNCGGHPHPGRPCPNTD